MKQNAPKIYLISADKVGSSMAGPGMRYFEMAKILSKHFPTTLLVPDDCDVRGEGFKIKTFDSNSASKSIGRQISDADIIISQNLRPPLLRKIRQNNIRFIVDLYDPLTVEVLEYAKDETERQKRAVFDFNYYSLLLQMLSADHLLCASPRQRDFYCGILSDQKMINPDSYSQNPDLTKTISIVPFGLEKKLLPKSDLSIVEAKIPNLKPSDKIVFWGGGIFNWFDPLSIVKAIEEISKTRNDIKLFFLGVKHPNPKIKQMKMALQTIDHCKKHNLVDKFVFFNYGWTPYRERTHFLSRANIGISTHNDNLETRLSFRTRVLDYLWAELPLILTEGDFMADLCQKHHLGRVVRFNNVADIKKAIIDLCDNKAEISQIKNNIFKIKKNFYWENCLKDLIKLIKENNWQKKRASSLRFWSLTLRFYLAGFRKKFFK